MKKGWQLTTLDRIATNLDSRRIPITKAVRASGEYPYYGASGIVDHVADFIFDEVTLLVSEDGANLLARTSPIAFPASGKYWVNNHAHVLKFEDLTTQRFVELYLASIPLAAYVTGAAQPKLNQKSLNSIPIPLPKLPEQQRIVAILDEALAAIDTAKANAEKNVQNARAVFESHLNALFSRRGDGRAEKRLEEMCSFGSGGTPSKNNSNYWNGKIPWVSGRDMKSAQLWDTTLHISQHAVDESSTRIAPAGSLLVLVRGMGLAHGAQLAELMVPCAFNQDIRSIKPKCGLLPRYLLFALRVRINASDNILSNAAHGTLKIDMYQLQKVQIPVPPPQDQERIILQINALHDSMQHLESLYRRELAALDELKKSVLHRAFSGQL